MYMLHGYHILAEFSTENAGLSRWTFCEKGGRTFFIKEFLSPVYPVHQGELSARSVERKKKVCETYYAKKSQFYKELEKCRTGNNVIVQDFFRDGSHYYIVTDKIDSVGSDPKLISKLGDDQKTTIIRSILYSIAELHRRRIVHADIKADNVLLKETADGYYAAKIIDFDAGFLEGDEPEEIQGDFVYMAPETFLRMQGESVSLTGAIDMFALGILFHQYWTGELPKFSSEYQYAFEAILNGSTLNLSLRIPDAIRTVLEKMLAKDVNSRISPSDALMLIKGARNVSDVPLQQRASRLKKSKEFTRHYDS